MNVSSSVHRKESYLKLRFVYLMECTSEEKLFKVPDCIYQGVFIARKVHSKLRNVYIMECSSQ